MTLDGVPLDLLGYSAGWAIVALFVIAIMRGNLVPRRAFEDAKAGFESTIADIAHDRDMWRAAHMVSEQGRVTVEQNQRELLVPVASNMAQLFKEMQDRYRAGRGYRNDSGGSQHEQEEDL